MAVCSQLWVATSISPTSFSAPHSNTQPISYIQQGQTSHQAQQLHCLKSTEHEGLNKKSVSISVPADREDKGQDWGWYFKQKVDTNYPCILLSGEWNLICRTQKQVPQSPSWAEKELQPRGWMLWLCAGYVGTVHEHVSACPFRQVRPLGGKESCVGGFN